MLRSRGVTYMYIYTYAYLVFNSTYTICKFTFNQYDLIRLLSNELLGTSTESTFGWLCPNIIRDDNCLKNKVEMKQYFNMSFKASSRLGNHHIILVPYIEKYVFSKNKAEVKQYFNMSFKASSRLGNHHIIFVPYIEKYVC